MKCQIWILFVCLFVCLLQWLLNCHCDPCELFCLFVLLFVCCNDYWIVIMVHVSCLLNCSVGTWWVVIRINDLAASPCSDQCCGSGNLANLLNCWVTSSRRQQKKLYIHSSCKARVVYTPWRHLTPSTPGCPEHQPGGPEYYVDVQQSSRNSSLQWKSFDGPSCQNTMTVVFRCCPYIGLYWLSHMEPNSLGSPVYILFFCGA